MGGIVHSRDVFGMRIPRYGSFDSVLLLLFSTLLAPGKLIACKYWQSVASKYNFVVCS